MKKLNRKKGFTIVELVIVIAVVGVLTAVLVPTFVNLTNRAKEAENQTFVRNLNTQMGIREATEGKNKTMYEAMMEAEDIGYNVEKLTPVNGNDVVWDSVANRFAIVDKDGKEVYSDGGIKATKKTDLWKIYAKMPETQTYSIYAKEGWEVKEVKNLKVGFDAGKNTGIATVSYVGASSGQKVVIRTNSELAALNVNAPLDTVHHYGQAGLIDIISVDSKASYHEHGEIALAKIANGRIVVTEEAEIGGIHAVATNDAFNDIKVAVVGNTEVPQITRDAVSEDSKTEEGTYTKFVLEVQTIATEDTMEDNPEYVWVSVVVDGEGEATTTTQVANSKETLSEETKIAESSQSKVVKSIAESTEEATSAEAAEKALVSTLISNMDQLKSYITGDVVNGVIGSDIEVTEAMELGCDKVLNLNGHTLSVNMSSGRPFVFSNSQSMVVNANDGGMKITNNNAYGLFRIQSPGVKLTLNGGNYEGYVDGAAAIIWVGNVNNQLTHSVDIELNNLNVSCVGQFVRDSSCAGHPNYDEYREQGLYGDTLKVNGGNYTFNNAGIDVNGSISGFVLQYMDVEFNRVTATSAIGSIMELDGGNGLFKDNNFTVQNSNNIQGWNATTIGVAYEATIKVESGVYSGFFGISVFTSGGHIIMNGGTVVGTSHAFDLYDDDNRLGNNQVTTLDIYGGTVTGDIYKRGSEAVVNDHR